MEIAAVLGELSRFFYGLKINSILSALPPSHLCPILRIASTLLPTGWMESRWCLIYKCSKQINKQPCGQVEMRKVGVDGGAANGGGGGTKRSAPGHGPTKNRLTITSFFYQLVI